MSRYSSLLGRSLLCLLAWGLTTAAGAGQTADRVFGGVNEYRAEAGVELSERLAILDQVAMARASRIAGLPDKKRLSVKDGISPDIRALGLRLFGELRTRVDLSRGYKDPASSIIAKWTKASGWKDAMDPRFDLAGAADYTAADGTLVFVMLLVESSKVPDDVEALATLTLDAVNAVRHRHALEPLTEDSRLRDVASSHSKDMARHGYFSHRDRDGNRPADRLDEADISYRMMAENIQMSLGARNPIETAVQSWMDSPGHRKNILDERFTHSGIGVHIRKDGTVYFTQMFLLPPA
ncbi:MAG: CAP domain-containing protein [Acidobacteriota bacterium]|nr:CAP domain-containing protein [Acidobacteriota bacterium]MDH3785549.1 CAP domain-containing protein [Acidobacteriota bacterium]